ncbi:MAG: hypothetical protein ABI321_20375 [Polyangia bacterium]
MLGPRVPLPNPSLRSSRRTTALDTLELHVPRSSSEAPLDVVLSFTQPRLGHGLPYLDVGVLSGDGTSLSAQSSRTDASAVNLQFPLAGLWRPRWPGMDVELELDTIAHRGGVSLARATGRIVAPGCNVTLDQRLVFLSERRAARRPYAWTRATLRGEVDGEPIVCVVETARRRAGSVVLPELGRLRLFGPGARSLPRDCSVAPLPIRAEYGTGRLRAAAISPTHKLIVELDAPPTQTALFEMVDPDGEAAYAHRASDAKATLTLTRRKVVTHEVSLGGRFEWGARAGDPRVAHRAWRA